MLDVWGITATQKMSLPKWVCVHTEPEWQQFLTGDTGSHTTIALKSFLPTGWSWDARHLKWKGWSVTGVGAVRESCVSLLWPELLWHAGLTGVGVLILLFARVFGEWALGQDSMSKKIIGCWVKCISCRILESLISYRHMSAQELGSGRSFPNTSDHGAPGHSLWNPL